MPRRIRRVDEEEREERSRRRDSVAILLDNDSVEAGAELRLRPSQFAAPRRELVTRGLLGARSRPSDLDSPRCAGGATLEVRWRDLLTDGAGDEDLDGCECDAEGGSRAALLGVAQWEEARRARHRARARRYWCDAGRTRGRSIRGNAVNWC